MLTLKPDPITENSTVGIDFANFVGFQMRWNLREKTALGLAIFPFFIKVSNKRKRLVWRVMEACCYILVGTAAAAFNRSSQEAVNMLVACSFCSFEPCKYKDVCSFPLSPLMLIVFLCLYWDAWGLMCSFFFCFEMYVVIYRNALPPLLDPCA